MRSSDGAGPSLRLWVSCALALCLSTPCAAGAEPLSLRDFLFGDSKPSAATSLPPIARYQSESGTEFVLDRSTGRQALIKFGEEPEIWALTATPGPRGDVIYKNDMGQPVLRATRLGGLTLFTQENPGGAAAAPAGLASAPRPPTVLGPEALWQVLVQASGRASRAAQHLIWFDAGDVSITPSTETVFADAFALTADAIVRTARGRGVAQVSRLTRVRFVQGRGPGAFFAGQQVQITVAPQLGVAGRPSSQRIAAALSRR